MWTPVRPGSRGSEAGDGWRLTRGDEEGGGAGGRAGSEASAAGDGWAGEEQEGIERRGGGRREGEDGRGALEWWLRATRTVHDAQVQTGWGEAAAEEEDGRVAGGGDPASRPLTGPERGRVLGGGPVEAGGVPEWSVSGGQGGGDAGAGRGSWSVSEGEVRWDWDGSDGDSEGELCWMRQDGAEWTAGCEAGSDVPEEDEDEDEEDEQEESEGRCS